MNCQIDTLQMDPRYKEVMGQFCSDPQNEQACREICELAPEELQAKIEQIEGQLLDWTENGVPPEVQQAVQAESPEFAAEADTFLNNEAPQIAAQEQGMRGGGEPPMPQAPQNFAEGGLATQGRFGDNQLVHAATGEMFIPNKVLNSNPGLRQGLGSILNQSGADPRQFTVGNENASINPRTGLPEYGLFSGGGLLGGVIGAALAIPTGGMSIAVGAGLGAGAGTLLGGGSLTDAVMAGGMFYGGASLLAGGGAFGASAKLGAATWAGGGGGAAALGNGYLATGAAGTAGAAAAPGLSGLAPGALNATGQIGLGASGGVGTLGGGLSATTAGNSVGALTMNAPLQSALAVPAATTTPSLLSKAGTWIGNNKGSLALAGLAAGTMEAPQVAPPPSGAEYFNEYDAYKDCLAAGGSESACQSSHPKGYAEIAPPPKSQWIAGMGNSSGAPGTALNPTGQVALNDQPWRQQLNQFGYAEGGAVSGRGSETSDSIPANLSNNEFVITADAVRGAGNGSIQRGASKLYDLMDKLERRAYNGR